MASDWYDEMEKAEQEYDAREYELAQEYSRGYEQGKSDATKELPTSLYCDGYNDGYKALHKEFKDSFEELNRLMCEYFEKWDIRKELTELEKLALHIVTIGMQDLSAFIDKSKDTGEVSF